MPEIRPWESQEQYDEWIERLMRDMPESWDGDHAAEDAIAEYVRVLEQRVTALGGSLERHDPSHDDARAEVVAIASAIDCPADLAAAYTALAELEAELVKAARRLHAAGASWADLAAPFGITRQGARKRWGTDGEATP